MHTCMWFNAGVAQAGNLAEQSSDAQPSDAMHMLQPSQRLCANQRSIDSASHSCQSAAMPCGTGVPAMKPADIAAARGTLRGRVEGTSGDENAEASVSGIVTAGAAIAKRAKVVRNAWDKADERNTHTLTLHDS